MLAGIKDQEPELRTLSVAAVRKTGLPGGVKALEPLLTDKSEDVRIALARTLGEMSGPDVQVFLLSAFEKASGGPFLDALVESLGKRSSRKDRKALEIVMKLFENPGASQEGVFKALNVLTGGKGEQPGWKAADWKRWYAKLLERDVKEAEAKKLADGARATAGQVDRALKALKDVERAQELYEECAKSAREADEEDAAEFAARRDSLNRLKAGLIINAPVDLKK
jgi:hypothetical protein